LKGAREITSKEWLNKADGWLAGFDGWAVCRVEEWAQEWKCELVEGMSKRSGELIRNDGWREEDCLSN
jgi:hypothetical protein